MVYIEVCANGIESALAAEEGGAVRVELCDNLAEGGTTPSIACIREVVRRTKISVNVIIRPRGGDFLYSAYEFDIMKADIAACGKAGCNGVVVGMLNPNGTVDKARCSELVSIAHEYGMEVTFHRAFDRAADLFKALEDAIELGCKRVLTSGGAQTAVEGAVVIKQLAEQASGRIAVMPGSGVTEHNIAELVKQTGLKEFHGTFGGRYPSKMLYHNPKFSNNDEAKHVTNAERVKAAINNASNT